MQYFIPIHCDPASYIMFPLKMQDEVTKLFAASWPKSQIINILATICQLGLLLKASK